MRRDSLPLPPLCSTTTLLLAKTNTLCARAVFDNELIPVWKDNVRQDNIWIDDYYKYKKYGINEIVTGKFHLNQTIIIRCFYMDQYICFVPNATCTCGGNNNQFWQILGKSPEPIYSIGFEKRIPISLLDEMSIYE